MLIPIFSRFIFWHLNLKIVSQCHQNMFLSYPKLLLVYALQNLCLLIILAYTLKECLSFPKNVHQAFQQQQKININLIGTLV